jgi:plastocyanin
MRPHRTLVMGLAAALICLAVGCGDGDDEEAGTNTTATTTSETTVTDTTELPENGQVVEMVDYDFLPKHLTAAPGEVIVAENKGRVPHNLTITAGADPENPGESLVGTEEVEPHKSGAVSVDLPPGDYGVVCTIPGHAEEGMFGTIRVR